MAERSTGLVHIAGIVVGVALVAYMVSFGDQARNGWTDRDRVGACDTIAGDTAGGEVLAFQSALWAVEGYEPVDSKWDGGTENATRAFQSYAGLPADGCVADPTWVTMRALAVSICAPGHDCGGPDHRIALASPVEPREAWFAAADCDWGTYVLPGVARSPVSSGQTYAFREDELQPLGCKD